MRHFNDEITWLSTFEMSFFHWIPALLWTISTPFLFYLYSKFPLKGDTLPKSIIIHLALSVGIALALKVLSLTLDFTIKFYIGLMDAPILEVLKSVVWVIPASTFKELFLYWVAIGVLRLADADQLQPSTLTVSGEHGLVPLPVESIYWMESNRNYIDIHSENEKYKLRHSMGTIENELNSDTFLRIHRSYIVNKSMVKTLKHWRRGEYLITLKNQKVLTSSRSFSQNVKQLIQA